MNTIHWTPKAARQLRKLRNPEAQKRIYRDVQMLTEFPDCPRVKQLTNHYYSYRLRIGDYRVFFEFDGGIKVVFIEEVKKRDEHTY